jgi:hypothetical protein
MRTAAAIEGEQKFHGVHPVVAMVDSFGLVGFANAVRCCSHLNFSFRCGQTERLSDLTDPGKSDGHQSVLAEWLDDRTGQCVAVRVTNGVKIEWGANDIDGRVARGSTNADEDQLKTVPWIVPRIAVRRLQRTHSA